MPISFVTADTVEIVDASEDDDQILSTAGLGLQPGDVICLAPNQGVNGSTIVADPAGAHQVVTDSSPGSGSISSAGFLVLMPDPVPATVAVKWSEPDDGSLVYSAWRGVDWDETVAANSLDSFTTGWAATAAPTSSVIPTKTAPVDGCRLIGVCDMASGSEAVTAVGGTIIADGSERNGVMADFGTVDAGPTGTRTFEGWPASAYRVRSYGILLVPADAGTAEPVVHWAIVGAATDTGFRVKVKTQFADSVRLKVGTNSAVTTGVVYSDPAVPDGDGYAELVFDEGAPNTRYYYLVESTDADEVTHESALLGAPRTRRTPGQPASMRFGFGSCFADFNISGVESEGSFDRLLARDPDFVLHTGDWDYQDEISTSQAAQLAALEVSLQISPGLRALVANTPLTYSKSDHDFGANNAFPGVWTPANLAAALQMFPYPTRPDPDALYHSFVDGRVRFIILDTRSYAQTDGSTRLGATQLAWLYSELLQREPLKFVVMDSTWIDTRPVDPGDDTWELFATERAAIGDFIKNTARGRVRIIHGDQHCLSADDGSNNPFGEVPMLCAAPWFQASSFKTPTPGSDWSEGRFPTVADQPVEQYGWVEIDDDGEEISWTYTGYDSDDIARVTYAETFAAPMGPLVQGRVDGATVEFAGMAVRLGETTVPVIGAGIRQAGVTVPLI